MISEVISLHNCVDASDVVLSNEAFCTAVQFMGDVLDRLIDLSKRQLLASRIVEEAIAASLEHIAVLPCYIPWKGALFESKQPGASSVYFIVCPSAREGYCWQCVPESLNGRDWRFSVPESWWGLSGEKLCRESGVADAEFCHKSGFMGAARSLSGAIEMARNAMLASRDCGGIR